MKFKIHDRVRIKSTGELGVIIGIRGSIATVLAGTGSVNVHVSGIELANATPVDLLLDGQLSDGRSYGLRLQAMYLQHAYQYDPKSGLSNARIEPKLYQVFVAHRVANSLFPRMILADEVGLGKTIEAGLVVKELRARKIIDRVLIICPASLQAQWEYELRSKFNEPFTIFDSNTLKFLRKDGNNPWLKRNNAIVSKDLAIKDANTIQIVEAGWDMVVFDEAHHVRRKMVGKKSIKIEETKLYKLANLLRDQIFGLLLLTATPMQLHPFELYSLIELIDPSLYKNFKDFERYRKDIPHLNNLMKDLLEWETVPKSGRKKKIEELNLGMSWLEKADFVTAKNLDDSVLRQIVITNLVSRHPVAQTLIRNRKARVGGFMDRIASRIPVKLTEEEYSIYQGVTDYIRFGYDRATTDKKRQVGFRMATYQRLLTSSSYALRESFENRIRKLESFDALVVKRSAVSEEKLEQLRDSEDVSLSSDELEQIALDKAERELEIKTLKRFIKRLEQIRDSKAECLVNDIVVNILDEKPEEKILIFTGFLNTQKFLEKILQAMGYTVAIFNGGMDLQEKERSVNYFRGKAQIMITTEAGGEGRNFQFAHIMVNYDLPWNPMKVEQRIGRLDRIGQTQPVRIYNLYNERTLEERILDVLEFRIQLFTESVGSLDPILGKIEREIERIVVEHMGDLDQYMDNFERDIEKEVKEARLKEKILSDLILDDRSFRKDETNKLLERSTLADHNNLKKFMSDTLDLYGGRLTKHRNGGISLALSQKLAKRVKADSPVTIGVFDPKKALEREDLDFFAFDHKVMKLLMTYVQNEGGVTGARRFPGLNRRVALEIIYASVSQGGTRPAGQMIRHVVDSNLQVVSEILVKIPPLGKPITAQIPKWVPSAVSVSKQVAIDELEKFRQDVIANDHPERQKKIEKISRIYSQKKEQLEARINRDRAWIEDVEIAGSENQKKMLKARKKSLQLLEQELQDLGRELELKVKELNSSADVRQTIIAAGLVVGE